MNKRVAVIFGSRSVEHEVSVITAQQVMRALEPGKYDITPIYITKDGEWYTGDGLRNIKTFKNLDLGALQKVQIVPDPTSPYLFISPAKGLFGKEQGISVDIVFPVLHGTYGEDGTLQGLLELTGVPYVGCGVVGSAVGMDKVLMKAAFEQNDLPVVDYLWFLRRRWEREPEEILDQVESVLPYPMFVKPANLGSSVGISKASDREALKFALDVASQYDRKLLVERSIEQVQEINCAVMGNEEIVPSACEEPISWEKFLGYDDKYLKGGAGKGMKGSQRKLPAEISEELTRHIQDLAVKAFQAIDGTGTARVDLLVDRDTDVVYVNEVNTMPGSLAFHLWQPVGLAPSQVVDNLLQLALEAWEDKARTTFSYSSPSLEVLDRLPGGRKILITPGMVELGDHEELEHRQMGVLAADTCDYVILVGAKRTRSIAEGLQAKGFPADHLAVAQDLDEATRHLQTFVQSGDVVLFENDLPDSYATDAFRF